MGGRDGEGLRVVVGLRRLRGGECTGRTLAGTCAVLRSGEGGGVIVMKRLACANLHCTSVVWDDEM